MGRSLGFMQAVLPIYCSYYHWPLDELERGQMTFGCQVWSRDLSARLAAGVVQTSARTSIGSKKPEAPFPVTRRTRNIRHTRNVPPPAGP